MARPVPGRRRRGINRLRRIEQWFDSGPPVEFSTSPTRCGPAGTAFTTAWPCAERARTWGPICLEAKLTDVGYTARRTYRLRARSVQTVRAMASLKLGAR